MSPEQAKRHFQALLAEISGDPRDLGNRFPDLFAVDEKTQEFKLLAEGVPAVPRSLLGQMDNDPRFSSNSIRQHLDVLRIYVTTAVRFLDAAIEDTHNETPGPFMLPEQTIRPNTEKVFVIHGRNTGLTRDFFSFLRALHLKPIEWSEAIGMTRNAAPYIGEVLDIAFASAQAVVVLLTPDDEVRLAAELCGPDEDANEREFRRQPRPNVLFEAGMALGRHPERTLLIEVGRVKAFSDIAGRHLVRLTNDLKKRQDVANRLRQAGCRVSTEGTDWHDVGDFVIKETTSNLSTRPVPTSPSSSHVEASIVRLANDIRTQADLARMLLGTTWIKKNNTEVLLFKDKGVFLYREVSDSQWHENSYTLGKRLGQMTLFWRSDGFRSECEFFEGFTKFLETADLNCVWALRDIPPPAGGHT